MPDHDHTARTAAVGARATDAAPAASADPASRRDAVIVYCAVAS